MLALAAAVVLALVFASSAFATTTFSGEDPADGTVVGTNRPPISITAADDSLLDITSGDITVGGFHVGTVDVTYPNFPDMTQAVIVCDTSTGAGLPWGLNTATVTVTNSLGEQSEFTWSFTTDVPPTIASITPAESSVVTSTLRPPISIKVDDADDASFSGIIFRVDTLSNRPYTYNAATKTFSWTPTTNLSDHASHTVTFQCMDAAGSLVSKVFSFRIDTTSQMTFTGRTPAAGATVTSATVPIDITVQADDPRYAIDTANSYNQILLDSSPLATTVTYPVPADTTIALLRSDTLLTDGAHTVTARVQDIQGLNATDTWSFTVAAPPVASSFTPASGTSQLRPTISARVTDNGPGTPTVTMRVDGTVVASSYNAGTGIVSYTPASDLADNASHTIDLSMTDASGNTSTANWSFLVQSVTTVTFSGLTPADGSTTPSDAPVIAASATGPIDLPAASAKLFLDGSQVSATITQPNSKRVDVSKIASTLPDGIHTARLEVTDAFGTTSTKSWTFTVAALPVLSSPTPAPNSTITTPRPAIKVTVSDNTAGNLNVQITLDGVQVYSASSPQGVVSYTPPANLANGLHSVIARATDGAGNVQTLSWGFTLSDLITASHTTTTNMTGCDSCHSNVLSTEHQNRGFDCNTCHNSTDPAVQNAISAKDTSCAACHASAGSGHQALHDSSLPNAGCASCHDANISTTHSNNCALCHQSTDPKVIAAIAAHKVNCSACHSVWHSPGSAATSGDGYAQWPNTQSAASGTAEESSGPHVGYTTTTVKCAVCHSVHGAPDNTWLLTKVTNANGTNAGQVCAYCHGYGASAGAHIVAINQAPASNSPHSSICYQTCHAGVHGLGASTYSVLATKLLRSGADTMIAAAIADPGTGLSASTFFNDPGVSPTKGQLAMATGYVCGQPTCHTQSAFAVATRGNHMTVQSRGGVSLSLSGHPVLAPASDNFTAPAGSALNTAGGSTGVKVAFAATNGCDTCHDLADAATTDGTAFPHNRGASNIWLTKASNASGSDRSIVQNSDVIDSTTGTTIGLADNYTTVQDGVCLKCHVSASGSSGVGKSF